MPKRTDQTEEVNGTGRDDLPKSFAMLEAANYADLRTQNGGAAIAFVRGHTNTGDGGESLFYWKVGDTRSENHGTIIRPTDPSGNWIRICDGPVNVKWFGKCKSLTND